MRGIVFLGDRRVDMREFPDPKPGPGQAVVAIRASGLCGSDLPPYRRVRAADAPAPNICGHEPCGVVAALGAGVNPSLPREGDRVIVHHYEGCGGCKYCRVGYTQLCARGHLLYGATANGGNADYLLVGASTLLPLPDSLSFEAGAAVACGTGTAYMALKRLDVSGRDTLAIYGQGPVGLSATMLATAMGARVVAIDVSPDRLALAHRYGAAETVNAADGDPVQAVRALTHGEGADATLDCTGQPVARVNAVRSARVWGRACFVGEGNTATFDVSPDIIHKNLTIYGSWTFSTVGMAECAQYIVDRRVPIEDLITNRFSLDQASEAFALFDAGTTGKCVFVLPG